MDLLQGDKRIASAEDLKWTPARQSYHYEPDFCGRMNVILDEPSPAQMTFRSDDCLVVGEVYTLSDGTTTELRIRISRANANRYTATVIDA